jgi:hypothetical protein
MTAFLAITAVMGGNSFGPIKLMRARGWRNNHDFPAYSQRKIPHAVRKY